MQPELLLRQNAGLEVTMRRPVLTILIAFVAGAVAGSVVVLALIEPPVAQDTSDKGHAVPVVDPSTDPAPSFVETEGVAQPPLEQPANQVASEPHSTYDVLRELGTPHDRFVFDMLRAYPNESYVHMINRTLNSRDPQTRALATSIFFLSTEDPVRSALSELANPVSSAADIAAAGTIAYHRAVLTDGDWIELEAIASDQQFPKNIGAALALDLLGDPAWLVVWVDEAVGHIRATAGRRTRVMRAIFEGAHLAATHTTETLPVLEALAEYSDTPMGRKAQEYLQSFETEPDDLEDVVRHALDLPPRGKD